MHANESINAVDKYKYRKSLMYGQAAETISWFSVTCKNYEVAVNLLNKRYGNKQVSSHVQSLLRLPAATIINETRKLQAIYGKNICITFETYGSFLAPVIMAKIPK